jgi:hypothetical protein
LKKKIEISHVKKARSHGHLISPIMNSGGSAAISDALNKTTHKEKRKKHDVALESDVITKDMGSARHNRGRRIEMADMTDARLSLPFQIVDAPGFRIRPPAQTKKVINSGEEGEDFRNTRGPRVEHAWNQTCWLRKLRKKTPALIHQPNPAISSFSFY